MICRYSLLLLGLMLMAGNACAADRYRIDPDHSYANFAIGHLGLSTLHGRIDVTGGTLVMDRSGGDNRVDAALDPASVDTGNARRDEDLRQRQGFFDVARYPAMRFRSSRIRFAAADPSKAEVTGSLTLHGVTRPVTLQVDDIVCKPNPLEKSKYSCGMSATTTIRRSDFGMDAFVPLVADTVAVQIDLEADRIDN